MSTIKKRGTFLVDFGNGELVVFGNNYKPWWQHALEFTYRKFGSKTKGWRYKDIQRLQLRVSYSNQTFYDNGGLKWCGIKAYQEVVDEVCERNRLTPVLVKDIHFEPSPSDQAVLTKKLKEY